MKLSKVSGFGIKIDTYLTENDTLIKTKELAKRLNRPYNHLKTVIQGLIKLGMRKKQNKKNGDLKLNKTSEILSLKSIIDALAGPTKIKKFLDETKNGNLEAVCKIKHKIEVIPRKINSLYETVTIKETVK